MKMVQPRPTARIPIVQFVDPETEFECDISFNNPLAMCNTSLLRAYSEVDPRVRPLAFIIKAWSRARLMNSPGEGTLSSYGYILLLLHYLQTRSPAVVPNLQRLPPDWDGSYLPPGTKSRVQPQPDTYEMELNPVDGTPCKTYFYQPADEGMRRKLQAYGQNNKQSVAELLVGFFKYYAYDFDFRASVVSVQTGGPITKVSKAEIDGWPLHERLSIEDPFETSYDVGHVVKTAQMVHVHSELLRAYTLVCRAGLKAANPVVSDPQSNGHVIGTTAAQQQANKIRKPDNDRLPDVKLTDLLGVILQPIGDNELPRFVEEARERQEQYKAKMAAEAATVATEGRVNGQ